MSGNSDVKDEEQSIFGSEHDQRTRGDEKVETSHDILVHIKAGNTENFQRFVAERGERDLNVLLEPSVCMEYRLRTPLMVAAAEGDFELFTAVRDEVYKHSDTEEPGNQHVGRQLTLRDCNGMTVAMLAVCSGNIAIVRAVLSDVEQVSIYDVLLAEDCWQRSVLIHAAGSGNATVFGETLKAIQKHCEDKVQKQLGAESAGSRTIFMHAAQSANRMCFIAVKHACQMAIPPKQVQQLLQVRDCDGLTLLMHAVIAGGKNWCFPQEFLHKEPHQQQATSGMRSAGQVTTTGKTNNVLDDQDEDCFGMLFKSVFEFVRECLWKEEVREQLVANDSSRRTILALAVLSDRTQVFDVVFQTTREHLLDFEVRELLGIIEDDGVESAMEAALKGSTQDMKDLVAERVRQLQIAATIREKASAIDAKIQSFIPGKTIVIFQLLVPVLSSSSGKFYLLLILCALAPLLSWASFILARETTAKRDQPRRTYFSLFLSAPALFFWGIGTSTVAESYLGWNESVSAAFLAVAAIAIPGLETFFGSQTVNRWYDKDVEFRNIRRVTACRLCVLYHNHGAKKLGKADRPRGHEKLLSRIKGLLPHFLATSTQLQKWR